MRRTLASWAALLGVVAFVCLPLAALAQRRGGVPFGLNWNRGRPATSALLSMALTGNCEGTTPAGLTFSRTSTATCTRADGTLVTLAAGQPRLTQWGWQREDAATNLLLRSEEADSAPWASAVNGGLSAPVVTPNADGTAEQLDFPAVAGATAASTRAQSVTLTATQHAAAIEVRGVSGSGTLYLIAFSIGATTWEPAGVCTYTAAAYTRCPLTFTATAGSWSIRIGVDRRAAGTADQPAQSVYVRNAQLETGPVATSYIPTQGTQVTRAADAATVSGTGWPTTDGAVFVRYKALDNTSGAGRTIIDSRTGTNGVLLTRTSGDAWQALLGNGTSTTNSSSAALTWTAGQAYLLGARWASGGNFEALRDGVAVQTVPTATQPTAHAASVVLGGVNGAGWYSQLCVATQAAGGCP